MPTLPSADMLQVSHFRAQFPTGFPETDFPDALVEARLSEALLHHAVRPLATLYATAHLLALDGQNTGKVDGGAGVVTGQTLGPQSVEYATMAATDAGNPNAAFWATTSYGRRYLALIRTSPRASIGARIVG